MTTALVGTMGLTAPPALAAPEPGTFHTSFEAEDPQPTIGVAAAEPINFTGDLFPAGSLLGLVVDATSAGGNSPGHEGPWQAADLNPSTKWLVFNPQATLTFELSEPASITSYSLTSANDAPDRDPRAWLVQASTDGVEWVDVDDQEGQAWQEPGGPQNRFETKEYRLEDRSAEYRFWRLNVTSVQSGGLVQLADFNLIDADRDLTDSPMGLRVTGGPGFSHTARTGVGWTGVRSLQYSGQAIADGPSSASNVLFDDLELAIAEGQQLTYKIFPVLDRELNYAATHVAVDLVFADGTTLSASDATDIYGFGANARAQGEGKVLYPDQWNSVVIDLSPFAGRTVQQILLSYDQAEAVAGNRVTGFIDDITVDEHEPIDTSDGLISYVDTRRGTNSSGGFSRGLTAPMTAWPNGFNFVTPFTDANTNGLLYSYQQRNNAENLPTLQGIGFSHQPSIWMGDRNQLITMPSLATDTPDAGLSARALPYRHDDETARPDIYAVEFTNGIHVAVTPTDHAAIFRYTFPGDVGTVMVDQGTGSSGLNVDATGKVWGWVHGGSGYPGRTRMFVAGQFDAAPVAQGAASGRTSARFARFDTAVDKTVELRLATSFISLEQAQRNLDLEATGVSFEDAKAAVMAEWNDRLSIITDVQGAKDHELVTLYSGLYRLNLYPNSQFENTGTREAPVYRYASPVSPTEGAATDTHTNAKIVDGKVHVNNGFWDTYRTAWPAYALLYPDGLAAELVDGFVQQYRDGGWIARWSSPGYADLMTGTSSDVSFAEAYLAGAIDTELALEAYDAALRNATAQPESNAVGRKGIERGIFLGWTDASTHESASWGLEGFINDFGIAAMARALAEDPDTPPERVAQLLEEADYFEIRANHFVEMYNPAAGVFTARNADGSWPVGEDFDKMAWGGAFTEASGWTFAFHAPHDVDGMAALYGGRQGLLDELHEFLSTPERAEYSGIHEAREARDVRLGMLGISNQVAHHIPYVLAEAGDPSGAQALIREILQRIFVGSDIGQGYVGDEDNGEMSAWYIFSALGFYPLQVGSGDYTVGSPLFDSITLNLPGGPLTINAPGASDGLRYVAGLSHNGTALTATTIDGDLIRSGGTLDFTMSATPTSWGAKDLDEELEVPKVHVDATTRGFGTLTSADETNVAALTDDDMRTDVVFDGHEAELMWSSSAGPVSVYQYTVTSTSGDGVAIPTSWTLEGSTDAQTWVELDARAGQEFIFPTQTRPFSVEGRNGGFTHFRLTISSEAGTRLGLAELELFAVSAEGTQLQVNAVDPLRVRAGEELDEVVAMIVGGELGDDAIVTVDYRDGSGQLEAQLTPNGLGGWFVRALHTFERPGEYDALVTVTDSEGSVASATTRISVFVDNTLTGLFNNVCIGDLGQTAANCDGQGHGYYRDKLAASGFVQGETLTVPGTELTYDLPEVAPGEPDNITGDGQTVHVRLGEGATQISFIGTGTEANRQTVGVITYTDGTTQDVPINFGDWVGAAGNPVFGNVRVGLSEGRLSGMLAEGGSPKNTAIYATAPFTLATDEEGVPKTVATITMPQEPGSLAQGRIHVFAIADDGERSATADLTVTPAAVPATNAGVQFEATLATVEGPDLTDATAVVNWGDGTAVSVVDVADAAVTASHTYAAPGTYTVWVTVSDGVRSASASLEIAVGAPIPTGLEITSPPTVQRYLVGEQLDLNGLTARVTFSDGTTTMVGANDLDVSGYDPDKIGKQTLTAAYTSGEHTVSATFEVTVAALTGIVIQQPPTRTTFDQGEPLDLEGMVVVERYSDGVTVVVPNDQLAIGDYDPQRLGRQSVRVVHVVGEKAYEATFNVVVKAATTPPPTTPPPTEPGPPKFQRTAPYTLPGLHRQLNGRDWYTTCEPYSQTERCRTEIWATTVVIENGRFVRKDGWAFNNLTYLPFMKREDWKNNPLGDTSVTAADGTFTSGGRQWRTECDTAATGRGGCRSFVMATVYSATPSPSGGYTFAQRNQWVFNNIVMFGDPSWR